MAGNIAGSVGCSSQGLVLGYPVSGRWPASRLCVCPVSGRDFSDYQWWSGCLLRYFCDFSIFSVNTNLTGCPVKVSSVNPTIHLVARSVTGNIPGSDWLPEPPVISQFRSTRSGTGRPHPGWVSVWYHWSLVVTVLLDESLFMISNYSGISSTTTTYHKHLQYCSTTELFLYFNIWWLRFKWINWVILGEGQIRVHVNLHVHEFDLFNSFSVTDDYIT